ncbi:hypothetical protein TNCT_613761 [Trichonephila clavata]|uniref:Uncharacterized protein n=1 Tax=Trichonephila clavata TaxID=2740835 RepID=A0A8X6HPK8_TRICU|nr:hypothetical protein TNCT_613761 [Trichonephila clavata]
MRLAARPKASLNFAHSEVTASWYEKYTFERGFDMAAWYWDEVQDSILRLYISEGSDDFLSMDGIVYSH